MKVEINIEPLVNGKQELDRLSEILHNIDTDEDEDGSKNAHASRKLIYKAREIASELEDLNPNFSFSNMGIDCEGCISAFAIGNRNETIQWYENCEAFGFNGPAINIDGFYEKDELMELIK